MKIQPLIVALLLLATRQGFGREPGKLSARPCEAKDLPGYWLLTEQKVLAVLPPTSTLEWPHQVLFFKSDGTMVELRKRDQPIAAVEFQEISRTNESKSWSIRKGGWMKLGPGALTDYQCDIVISGRQSKNFPKEVHHGDILLTWTDPKTRKPLGVRLYARIKPKSQ